MNSTRIADAALGMRHVFLRDLILAARIGIYAGEQGVTQRIRVNVDLGVREDAPGTSRGAVGRDDLARVVDYAVVADRVRGIVAAGHVNLVETLAERIAEACLDDERVVLSRIRVEKLEVLPDGESAGVEVERRRIG
jgi:dihydroneopterin aldolase